MREPESPYGRKRSSGRRKARFAIYLYTLSKLSQATYLFTSIPNALKEVLLCVQDGEALSVCGHSAFLLLATMYGAGGSSQKHCFEALSKLACRAIRRERKRHDFCSLDSSS